MIFSDTSFGLERILQFWARLLLLAVIVCSAVIPQTHSMYYPFLYPESCKKELRCVLEGPNRQSLVFSERGQVTGSTLASHSAVPRGTTVTQMKNNRAIRVAAQLTQGL